MTLSERLAEARRQRLVDAGVLPPEPSAEEPVIPPEPAAQQASLGPVQGIEFVPAPVLHLVESAPAPAPADSGRPHTDARCPSCQAPALVDMVDLIGHTTHFSCDQCGTLWYTSSRTPQPLPADGYP